MALWDASEEKAVHSRLAVDGLMLQLLAELVRMSDGGVGAVLSDATGSLPAPALRIVTEYLREHLAEDVPLADLGALTGLTAFHLCRAFRVSTGLPPHRWHLMLRVERAAELLSATDRPITEIAGLVGYDDPGRLATAFRRAKSCTPREYPRSTRH